MLRDEEAVGSNPATPTRQYGTSSRDWSLVKASTAAKYSRGGQVRASPSLRSASRVDAELALA